MSDSENGIGTRAIRAGRASSGSSMPPVLWPSATFAVESFEEARRKAGTRRVTDFYGRFGNPTSADFAQAVADLEGAEAGMGFASGMGAITTVVLAVCSSGSHVVAQTQLFSSTSLFLRFACARFGIEATLVDGTDPDAIDAAVRPGQTQLVLVETPANPGMEVVDLERVGRIQGPIKLVDSTFATPVITRPLSIPGIDLVMHSATKGLSGHNDATLGVVVGTEELIDWIWGYHVMHGAVPSPFDSWNALRGLRTLGVRVRQQSASATAMAETLAAHGAVSRTNYPGLRGHPQADVVARQMDLPGGNLSFELAGGEPAVRAFYEAFDLGYLATSLGGPETLITHPATTTHAVLSEEERAELGITDGLIRMSVGLEDTRDLVASLGRGLEAAGGHH